MPLALSGNQLGLLRKAPDLRLLFLASFASSVGTWLAIVALVVDVFDRTGSASWVSALLIVEFAPLVLIGLAAGPLIDRLPRRRVLVSADLARAGLFCVIPFATSALQLVLLALLVGVATSAFRPAVYAGLPNLVEDDELPRANGLLQLAENVTMVAGPIVGGLLVAAVGPDPAYWVNAASFATSALLLLRIRRALETGERESQGHWRDVAAGLALARRSPALLTVLVAWSVVMFGSAGASVAEVVLAKTVFDAGDWGYGLMLSAMGLGLVLGGLWSGERVSGGSVRTIYAAAIAAMALGIGATAAAPSVWVAACVLVVAGAGNGAALVCNAVLVQRGVPDHLRGRAFTLAMSVGYAVLGLGMAGAGPLTDAVGARETWGVSAGLLAVAALAALALAPGEAGEPAPDEVVELAREPQV